MFSQAHIAVLSVAAFICIAIGYCLRCWEQKEHARPDETEHQVGDPL